MIDLDGDVLITTLASSDGDIHLACERLSEKLGLERDSIKEYDVIEKLSSLDMQSTDLLAGKLRTLLTIRLYNLIHAATIQLAFVMGDLKPAELARTHASLVNTFANITAPAAKITFDFDSEVAKLSEEFQIPADEIKGNIKSMESKIKAIK